MWLTNAQNTTPDIQQKEIMDISGNQQEVNFLTALLEYPF